MKRIAQGEVWWADLPDPAGHRPVVVLTRTRALPRLNQVTFAPITRTIRGIDTEVVLGPLDGLPGECAVSLDNIGTGPKELLDRRIIRLAESRMDDVFEAIRVAFDMPG